MKSTILNLKERILVVDTESPPMVVGQYELDVNGRDIEFICKGSELSEEIAKGLSERTGEGHPSYQGDWYIDYSDDDKMCDSALDSFISAIEANGFSFGKNHTKNPIKENYGYHDNINVFDDPPEWDEECYYEDLDKWQEAESKTFHPDRTILFKIL